MSNTITLAELKTQARERADMENSSFISDSELTSYINQSYADLYGILVTRYEDYFTIETTSTVTSGNDTITLPTDFFKLRGLDLALDNSLNNFTVVTRADWNNRNQRDSNNSRLLRGQFNVSYRIIKDEIKLTPSLSAAGTYRLYYIPIYTPLVDDTDTPETSISNQSWHEYIIVDAAIKMLEKEESNTKHLERQLMKLEERIERAAANRDVHQPETVSDTSLLDYDPDFLYTR
jgi:hypothetical protein